MPAPAAEAGVPVQAEEKHAAAWAVGEGGEGLEEVWGRAFVGSLGLHAVEFAVATAEGRDEAGNYGAGRSGILQDAACLSNLRNLNKD